MISIKETVDLRGMRPEVLLAIVVADQVYTSLGYNCVVTSVTDSKHKPGSLHGIGFAVDLRTKHVPVEQHQAIVSEMSARLGPQFDVVLETDHVHCEYDPQ